MPLLVINQTEDKVFRFTLKGQKYEVHPGTKNVIDIEACPLDLTRARSRGEIYVSTISNADVEFFKELSEKATVASEEAEEAAKAVKTVKTKVKLTDGEV